MLQELKHYSQELIYNMVTYKMLLNIAFQSFHEFLDQDRTPKKRNKLRAFLFMKMSTAFCGKKSL